MHQESFNPPNYGQREPAPLSTRGANQFSVPTDPPPGYFAQPNPSSPYGRNYTVCGQGRHCFREQYTVPGLLCAFLCFPCGLCCLFAWAEKRCVRCGHECKK